jgi:mannosyltransferase
MPLPASHHDTGADPTIVLKEPGASISRFKRPQAWALLGILAIALGLRVWRLGELSFWYDEVVTMRLAETPNPAALLERLFQIDATRAPLHPLLLQAWLRLFGTSEASARSLSVLCGIAAVGLVWWIGRLVFDSRTGLWGAWLAAISPLLVYYSREARMYAWLVMVTCLCWGLLFSLRNAARQEPRPPLRNRSARQEPRPPLVSRATTTIAYSLSLAALLYSHPLGLIMAGTLGMGALLFVRSFFGTWRHWLAAHLVAMLLAAPWLRHYFDHSPEFLSGRLPIKFLLGTPIGFLGGNSAVMLGVVALIAFGIHRRRRSFGASEDWAGPVCLILWLTLPPSLLYAYSTLGSPIFGPPRYTLFVAPAYLILTAQGLAMIPALTRYGGVIALALIAIPALGSMVYAPGLKADWRAFSAVLATRMARNPAEEVVVAVKGADPAQNVEVETARYYLPDRCKIMDLGEVKSQGLENLPPGDLYVAIGSRSGFAPFPFQDDIVNDWGLDGSYPGLAVYRVIGPVRVNPSRDRRSATPGHPGPG